MAVVSVPKDLDRLKKSRELFGQSTGCLLDLCDVVLLPWENNMLCVIFGQSQDELPDCALAHVS